VSVWSSRSAAALRRYATLSMLRCGPATTASLRNPAPFAAPPIPFHSAILLRLRSGLDILVQALVTVLLAHVSVLATMLLARVVAFVACDLYGRLPDLQGVFGVMADGLQVYIRPVLQAEACGP
jgi:hypothetical protein